MTAPVLRYYQARFVEAARTHVRAGRTNILGVAPTGAGKMVIAAAMIRMGLRGFNARSLFMCPRIELIDQAVLQLSALGIDYVGVIRADDPRTNPAMPVQVGTSDTLARRELPPADLVFSDECHHDAAPGRAAILDAYAATGATIVGFTATPWRLDGTQLWRYQALETIATYAELIKLGYLADPILYAKRVPLDLSELQTKGSGDYDPDELGAFMSRATYVGDVVKEWQAHAEDRRTLVFACNVAHSKLLVQSFLDAGIRAEHVDGSTPEDARKACWRRLDDGLCQVVSNVGIATEGFDMPSVKCLVIPRPTKSLTWWMQACGRAFRPWNGVRPILLDHGGNVDEHGFPHEDRAWSLEGRPKRTSPLLGFHVCPACFAYVAKNPCELCGFLRPTTERRVRADGTVELVQRQPEDARRAKFVRYVAKAKANGYAPGYASVKYKEEFGEWPPRSWSNETKMAFNGDARWQRAQEERARKRDWWKEQNEGGLEVEVPDEVREARVVSSAQEETQEGFSFDDVIVDSEIPF